MHDNTYIKISPNKKKKNSNCWALQVLFTLSSATIFETTVFDTPLFWKRANFDYCNIASKHESKHTHKSQKMQWWTPSHVHVAVHVQVPRPFCILHKMQTKCWSYFGHPPWKVITIILMAFTHFSNLVTRPPEN